MTIGLTRASSTDSRHLHRLVPPCNKKACKLDACEVWDRPRMLVSIGSGTRNLLALHWGEEALMLGLCWWLLTVASASNSGQCVVFSITIYYEWWTNHDSFISSHLHRFLFYEDINNIMCKILCSMIVFGDNTLGSLWMLLYINATMFLWENIHVSKVTFYKIGNCHTILWLEIMHVYNSVYYFIIISNSHTSIVF